MRKNQFENKQSDENKENNNQEKITRLSDKMALELKKLFLKNKIDLCLDKKYISEDLIELGADDYKNKIKHIIPKNENSSGIIKTTKRLKEKCFTRLVKNIKEIDKKLDNQDVIKIVQDVFQAGKRMALEEISANNGGKYDIDDKRHEQLLEEYTDMLAVETACQATVDDQWAVINEAKKAYNDKGLVYNETQFVDNVNKYIEQGLPENPNTTQEI